MYVAGLIAVNTTLAAASGGMAVVLIQSALGRPCDVGNIMNGILAGKLPHACPGHDAVA